MNTLIALYLIFSSMNCLAAANDKYIGFDKPLFTVKKSIGKSKDTNASIEFTCWAYSTFAVIQIDDPGSMGAKEIEVRPNDGSKNKEQLCGITWDQRKIVLQGHYGYFKGSSKNYLFIDEPDSDGGQQGFQIFSDTGEKKFQGVRNSDFPLQIKNRDLTSINFFKRLESKCPLAKDGARCWKEIILENKIPESINLQMPECVSSFKHEHSPLENEALIATQVEVNDLSHPVVKFIGGKVTCSPAP